MTRRGKVNTLESVAQTPKHWTSCTSSASSRHKPTMNPASAAGSGKDLMLVPILPPSVHFRPGVRIMRHVCLTYFRRRRHSLKWWFAPWATLAATLQPLLVYVHGGVVSRGRGASASPLLAERPCPDPCRGASVYWPAKLEPIVLHLESLLSMTTWSFHF
jgi:hypothetical protein